MHCPVFMPRKAFTLIELLIVVTLIVLITGATIPSFVGYTRNQTLIQATEQMRSDLRTIQNKALVGAQANVQVGGNLVQYWAVRFYSGASGTGSSTYDYFIAANNTTCPTGTIASPSYQGSSTISSEVEVKLTGTNAYKCVFFAMQDGSTTVASVNGADTIRRVLLGFVGTTANGNCRKVTFNANGLIYFVNNSDTPNCNYN